MELEGSNAERMALHRSLPSPQPPPPSGWQRAKNENGRVYYWNAESRERRWELPRHAHVTGDAKLMDALPIGGWQAIMDQKKGKPYFWHSETGERVWRMPTEYAEAMIKVCHHSVYGWDSSNGSLSLLRWQAKETAQSRNAARAHMRRIIGIFQGWLQHSVKLVIGQWKSSAIVSALDTEKAYEMCQMQDALAALVAETSRGAGLRMLKHAMARQMRGEIGMRLEIWRQQVTLAATETSLSRLRDRECGNGIKAMRQIMVRVAKGEVAMRVVIWRTAMQEENHADAMSLAWLQCETKTAAIVTAATNERLHIAICQIRQIWVRNIKGEIGLRVVVWRDTKDEARRAEESAHLRRGLEDRAADAMKAAGLRMLKQVMARLARGDQCGMLLQWQQCAHEFRHAADVTRVQHELELRSSEKSKGQGLKSMARIVTRITKGELGMRILLWRTAGLDQKRRDALTALHQDLQAKAASSSKGAGLRQLKQVMIRLAKGEASMRLEIWRNEVIMAAFAKHEAMATQLEHQRQAEGRGAGLRMLRQIMARQLKGEVGMRLEIWRRCRRMDVSDRKVAMEACDKMLTRDKIQGGSLQLLRAAMGRMLRCVEQHAIISWRFLMSEQSRLQGLSRLDRSMEARSHITRGCAMRIIAQGVGRRMRSSISWSLEAWQAALQLATFERHSIMQQELQAQLAQHSQSGLAALSPGKLAGAARRK